MLLVAVVAAYIGYRSCMRPDLGEKLSFGKGEVYYKDGATRDEAKRLGNYLKVIGYFSGSGGATVLLAKKDDHYVVSFVVKSGVEKDEDAVASMRQIGGMISGEVFGGAVVEVRLVDGNVRLKRTLEPVDATEPNLWSTPELVAGVDFDKVRASALYQTIEPKIREAVEQYGGEMGLECSWQAIESTHSIMARRYVEPTPSFLLVVRGIPRSMLVPCLQKSASRPEAPLEVIDEGNFTSLHEGELRALIRWLDAESFFIEIEDKGGPVAVEARLESRVTDQVGLDDHPALAAKAKEVDPTAAAWLAWAPRPPKSKAAPVKDMGARASILLDTGLRLDAQIRLIDKSQAEFFPRWIASIVDGLGEVPTLDKVRSLLKVEVKGRDVLVKASLDEAQLADLAATIASDDKLEQLLTEP